MNIVILIDKEMNMANMKFGIKNMLGNERDISATSWQVSKDTNHTQVIDESLVDKVNLFSWSTPLKDPVTGKKHADLDEVYARFKLHFGDQESEWIDFKPDNQNTQRFVYKYDDGRVVVFEKGELIIN